ncbi:MAG: zinc-binding protein, partial [Oscillospiraceae bacterium]|nr:zinc-binding protein [Oscillospiraceae bacterium]
FTAVCAGCGGEAKVPFQPREDRPVYCSDCFAKMKSE